jgi:hypothetical protein
VPRGQMRATLGRLLAMLGGRGRGGRHRKPT